MKSNPFHPEVDKDIAINIIATAAGILGVVVIAECMIYGLVPTGSRRIVPGVMSMLFLGLGLPSIGAFCWATGIFYRIRRQIKRNNNRNQGKDNEVEEYIIDMALSGDAKALELARYLARSREVPKSTLQKLESIIVKI